MASYDECLERLAERQRWWCERVEEEAGTTDADWDVFQAAAKLLADLENGIVPKPIRRQSQ